ncbi:hypothetical protein MICRO116_1050002 [Micrococcus sp. 116]|nr:hypothetical protein MICRO116_1050002 [Micrococcus sp. 116]
MRDGGLSVSPGSWMVNRQLLSAYRS